MKTETPQNQLIGAIERTLYDTRSLVAMLTSQFAICDDHNVCEGSKARDLWPGLTLVSDRIEHNLSEAIDNLNRLEQKLGKE